MVNEARVSFSRLNVEFGGGLNSFETVAGQLSNAFTNISFQTGGALSIGPATNLPQARLVNTWQAQDNWNYVFGKHSFKAGVNWTYQRSPNTFLPRQRPVLLYGSLASSSMASSPALPLLRAIRYSISVSMTLSSMVAMTGRSARTSH